MGNRPIIGLPTMSDHDAAGLHAPRFGLNQSYNTAVMAAGGVPLLIPHLEDADSLRQVYDLLDGLLLPGGVDIHPRFYGEEPHARLDPTDEGVDRIETTLLRWALADDKPVFGICRGEQVLNVVMGGSLWQDLPSQYATVFDHRESFKRKVRDYLAHDVRIDPHSRLAGIVNSGRVWVNTSHHQAIRRLAPGLRATAWSPDDLIEAVESPDHTFVLAVQWHPEELVRKHEWARNLFAALVQAAAARRAGQPAGQGLVAA